MHDDQGRWLVLLNVTHARQEPGQYPVIGLRGPELADVHRLSNEAATELAEDLRRAVLIADDLAPLSEATAATTPVDAHDALVVHLMDRPSGDNLVMGNPTLCCGETSDQLGSIARFTFDPAEMTCGLGHR